MRIHVDKIDDGPSHGLSAQDVRLILATVPPEWIEGLVEVRLANAPGPRAYLFHGEGRLTIYSRCGTMEQILREILSAGAAGENSAFHFAEGKRWRFNCQGG